MAFARDGKENWYNVPKTEEWIEALQEEESC